MLVVRYSSCFLSSVRNSCQNGLVAISNVRGASMINAESVPVVNSHLLGMLLCVMFVDPKTKAVGLGFGANVPISLGHMLRSNSSRLL